MAKNLCKPQSIVDCIEAIDNNADKINYIKNILDSCSLIEQAPPKKRGKRAMSGYNCFIKNMVAQGQPFGSVIKSGAWKTLETKQKSHWNSLAKQGCPEVK